MTGYLVTIQQQVYVNAESEEEAVQVVKDNPPHTDVTGFGRDIGAYSLHTLKSLGVIECAQAEKPRRSLLTGNY